MQDTPRLLTQVRDAIYRTRALLLRGDFPLSSGVTSSYYFDGKMLSTDPAGSLAVAQLLYAYLADTEVVAVGGLTMGADPIAAQIAVVSAQQGGRPLPAFMVRDARKAHGTAKLIEGNVPGPGAPVAIVDDVVTGGGSIQKAIDAVREHGCIVSRIVVILDRHEGGSARFRSEGLTVMSIFGTDRQGILSVEYPGFAGSVDQLVAAASTP
jgi:orotate phosphoribosyltransferase